MVTEAQSNRPRKPKAAASSRCDRYGEVGIAGELKIESKKNAVKKHAGPFDGSLNVLFFWADFGLIFGCSSRTC